MGIQKTNEQITGKVPSLPNVFRGLRGGLAVAAKRILRPNEARRGTGRETRGSAEPGSLLLAACGETRVSAESGEAPG